MFIVHICKEVDDNIYDCQLEKTRKEEICSHYHLERMGEYKEYWENNVCISVSENTRTFDYIEDVSISYNHENKYLIQEIIMKPCTPYNFYNVHTEENYILYEKELGNITVQLKEYYTYLVLTFQMENITHLAELNIYYI